MEVKLIVVDGKQAGREVPVTGPKFFIGRAEDCHLRPGSDLVSRHHAVILVEEAFVAVRDFGSKNGTFVNDERVRPEKELKTGDRLKIGPLEFEVQLSVEIGGKKKPKVQSVQEAAARTVESAASGDVSDDDELDISDWIEVEADSPTTTHISPVPSPDTTETVSDEMKNTTEVPGKDTDPGSEDEQDRKKGAADKRSRASRQPTAKDTSSAADDMLKQLFSRKR